MSTNTEDSSRLLQEKFKSYSSRVEYLYTNNIKAMREADVVILGFKPYMAQEILGDSGVREAIEGKLVISMLAGVQALRIQEIIWGDSTSTKTLPYVARAIPSVAAQYCQSMTILEQTEPPLSPEHSKMLETLFQLVGYIKYLPTKLVNLGTVLTTGSLATLSVALEGFLDGAVVEGLKRKEALELVAHGVTGLSAMLENGAHPSLMREEISSPRGCTIQTLMTVERGCTRATFAQALIDGTQHLDKTAARN
ncbi:pyrroline-5-carboxylate reductase [Fusarium beomiforme]|uniref:Pyrroline-5-carboxylate reductase n=1 Tax=Fusarium beomiforme TaxID=44412 RepID=A0A9P5ACI9_9HYPO|nr:pyrroline-5-carboxylate reductase [Fusarium beomiforme]